MLAASANSRVVVPAKPLRAKSGTAAAPIALRRSSPSNRVMAIATRKVSAHLPRVKLMLQCKEPLVLPILADTGMTMEG